MAEKILIRKEDPAVDCFPPDQELFEFMVDLDGRDVTLDRFEVDFVADKMETGVAGIFSVAQRTSIMRMIERYGL